MNPYNLSDETLEYLREHNPEAYAQFTRPAPTLPYWQAPKRERIRDLYQVVIAMFPPTSDAGGDVVEGEWE